MATTLRVTAGRPSGLTGFLALNLADCVVTWRALSLGAQEMNWYSVLMRSMLVRDVLLLKMALVGLIAYLIYKYRRPLFRPLNIGMALIVGFNLVTLILVGVLA